MILHPTAAGLQLPTTRRSFLAMTGLTFAGCAVTAGQQPSESRPTTTPDSDDLDQTTLGNRGPLGVALLGLGQYSSERLAPGLQKTTHCKLVGIVTGTKSKIPEWRERYAISENNVYSYDNLPSIATNPAIDVVYVVTPTALHARFAIAAAEAGKHVWCEKPMAMTASECQSVIDACRKNGVSLSIGYRMQHEPNTQTVIEYAHTKPYGAIRSAQALAGEVNGTEHTWRKVKAMGGGALYDMGVYTINGLRYALGEEPVRVLRAEHKVLRPEAFAEVDETTEFELEFPSGVIAVGKTSVGERYNKLSVECERGSYYLEPMQQYEGIKGGTSDGIALDQTVDHQQAKQMDDEALAIIEGKDPIVPGEEGLRDIRIVEAIFEAARTQQPVTIG